MLLGLQQSQQLVACHKGCANGRDSKVERSCIWRLQSCMTTNWGVAVVAVVTVVTIVTTMVVTTQEELGR